jgi:hypothetical protein
MRRASPPRHSGEACATTRTPTPKTRHGTRLVRNAIKISVAALVGSVLETHPVLARDITYTWHEDDGQDVAGSFIVLGTAQSTAQIQFSDVVSFSFTSTTLDFSFTNQDLDPKGFPIPISSIDASPADGTNILTIQAVHTTDDIVGEGHWSIIVASVPEPPAHVLAGIAILCGLAYGWSHRRRDQRHQAAL